jgi:hypothetical protein
MTDKGRELYWVMFGSFRRSGFLWKSRRLLDLNTILIRTRHVPGVNGKFGVSRVSDNSGASFFINQAQVRSRKDPIGLSFGSFRVSCKFSNPECFRTPSVGLMFREFSEHFSGSSGSSWLFPCSDNYNNFCCGSAVYGFYLDSVFFRRSDNCFSDTSEGIPSIISGEEVRQIPEICIHRLRLMEL